MKTLLDLAPLAVFFGAWVLGGLYAATAALIVACGVQCVALKLAYGKVDRVNLVVFGFTFALGGLTLVLQNDAFIKVKPTFVYAVFAVALLVADFGFRKNLIRLMMEKFFSSVSDSAWRKVSCGWAGFFLCVSLFNFWAAFSLSEAAWVKIKTFGYPAATFVFAVAQVVFISVKDSKSGGDSGLPSGAWRDAFPSGAWERQGGGGAWERQGGRQGLGERIAEKLAALNPLELEVRDESAMHEGHAEAGNGAHFRVRVVSEKFAGLSHLQRHRLVYETVGKPAEMGLHALAVRALSPDEAVNDSNSTHPTHTTHPTHPTHPHPKGESLS